MLWICLTIAAYFLGICLRKRSADVSDAILNWLTQPLLLLCGILYITLGVYTNTYMFMVFDIVSLLLMLFFSCAMYVIAFLFALLFKQPLALCKTIATHAAVPHCLLSLVSIRYSLTQPASDIASIAPIILLIFSSVPFIFELIFKLARDQIQVRLQRQEEEKDKLSRVNTQSSLQNGGMQLNNVASTATAQTSCIAASSSATTAAAVQSYDSIFVHEKITSV